MPSTTALQPAGHAVSGADVVVAGFALLTPADQEEAYARIVDVRLTRLVDADGDTGAFLRALRRAADLSAGELTREAYQRVRLELAKDGEELPEFSRVVRHFGSWARAKEALGLGDGTTVQKIEARFRSRRLGRPQFSADELADALRRCVAEYGRVPLLSEYEEWRLKELALMRARGEIARCPSSACYRRRHKSWEKALLAHGCSPDAVYVRLEPSPERRSRLAKVDRYSDATLRDTLLACASAVGHAPLVHEFENWRTGELKRRRSRSIVLPSDSPYRRRFGSWENALKHFGFSDEEIEARLSAGRERSTASMRNAHRT